jgi:hypothetical protein
MKEDSRQSKMGIRPVAGKTPGPAAVNRQPQQQDVRSQSFRKLFAHQCEWSWKCVYRNYVVIMFCWPCIIVQQYSETNLIHFLFNSLRIKGLYIFLALLAHPQKAIYKQQLVYCVGLMFHSNPGAANWHNTHAIYQVPLTDLLLRMSK